jgi:hypothetical protein
MLPAVFPLIKAATAVTALIGTNPCRCFRHGSAPQGVVAPYVTWYVVAGTPANTLDDVPRADDFSIQVDCWSDDPVQVETLAAAVRDALELRADMTAVSVNARDPETMRYRIGLTFRFWVHRAP